MGGERGMYGGQQRCIQHFGILVARLREVDHLEDLEIDGGIILKWMLK